MNATDAAIALDGALWCFWSLAVIGVFVIIGEGGKGDRQD